MARYNPLTESIIDTGKPKRSSRKPAAAPKPAKPKKVVKLPHNAISKRVAGISPVLFAALLHMEVGEATAIHTRFVEWCKSQSFNDWRKAWEYFKAEPLHALAPPTAEEIAQEAALHPPAKTVTAPGAEPPKPTPMTLRSLESPVPPVRPGLKITYTSSSGEPREREFAEQYHFDSWLRTVGDQVSNIEIVSAPVGMAVVGSAIADAFGMRGLPGTIVLPDPPQMGVPCACRGTIGDNCATCGGTGRVIAERSAIPIPPPPDKPYNLIPFPPLMSDAKAAENFLDNL